MTTKRGIAAVIAVVLGLFIAFYQLGFAITIFNPMLVIILLFAGCLLAVAFTGASKQKEKIIKICVGAASAGTALVIVLSILSSPVFNAKKYSSLFEYEEKDFNSYTASLDNIPLLDRLSADNIAIRRFGELVDYVSQYRVIDSEQILYRDKPVRLSVLEHASFWSWNKNKVTPGYISVDMQTQKAELVRTSNPVVYSETAYFFKNIYRYIRFKYPSTMFFYPTAELNEEGEVFWIAPTYKRAVGLYGGEVIDGLITVNAHTGEHHKYASLEDIPEWIDNVYPSDYIMNQYNYKGRLSNGFLNTLFAKTGMTMTTEGYNYLSLGDDNWIYTGITSVSLADESNIGFIVTNKRTKVTHYYAIAGAEEFSAMDSAEGEVQHLRYTATFPLLLNIEGIPTYLLSLKDKNELVKMYAMIQVEDYRKVVVDSDLKNLKRKYLNEAAGIETQDPDDSNNGSSKDDYGKDIFAGGLHKVEGVIQDKTLINIGGDSYMVFKLKGQKDTYLIPAADNLDLLFLQAGDSISVDAYKYAK